MLPVGTRLADLPADATLADVLRAVEFALDGALWIGEEHIEPTRVLHTLWVGRPVRDKVGLVIRTISTRDATGSRVIVATDMSLLPGGSEDGVPVSLGARRSVAASASPAN